ncbi:MAG: AAA family ATPase [Patescibacteria group bacterium]|jgi:predicted ATP-dependent endonuclease of OLD family
MAKYFQELNIIRPDYLGGNQWELKDLNEITILFGKNGSGKSQLLRTLRNSNQNVYHYTSPERAGDITHEVGITQEELTAPGRANRRQQNLSSTYRQEAVSRIQALLIKIGNVAGRATASSVDLGDIENFLQVLLPDFQFSITGENPPYEFRRIHGDDRVSSVNTLSSGEAEILTLALDLLTICAIWELDNQSERVLLIDEPDTHLHPDLQQHLGHFLVQLLSKYKVQMIIASHSTTLLSALGYHGGERTSVIYLNNSVSEQKAVQFDKILQELSTCLGGHALMGPLFSAPLLLVEGDDDNKIWSQVPRYNNVKLAVIPCSGADEVKRYQKTLEKIFASLRTDQTKAVGFALLDGDQTLPVADANNPQTNIKYVKLECRESENLFLSDEVLTSLGFENWEAAKTKVKEESQNYGEKKTQLDQCDSWDRKNADIKDVILQLSQILSSKNVPWTQRVAKCIGDKKPEGQLADFLGTDVINSIWG